jgi:hypothetical protein
MTFKNIFKFMVLVISILLANLIAEKFDHFLLSYRFSQKPYIFTWVGMLVVVAIYYPLFSHIDKWATVLSEKVIRSGTKFGGRRTGSILVFLLLLFTLYIFYGYEWFNRNIFFDFMKWVWQLLIDAFSSFKARFA